MNEYPPKFSIIIPAYNAEATIGACLQSVYEQQSTAPFEVIVVNSGVDSGAEIVAERFPRAELVSLAQRAFPGAARNIGIDRARGEVLVFVDATLVLPRSWLARIASLFESAEIHAVAGPRKLQPGASLTSMFVFYFEFFEFISIQHMRASKFAPAGNSAFRRTSVDTLRFPQHLRTAEDVVFCSNFPEPIYLDPQLEVAYQTSSDWGVVGEKFGTLGYWSGVARNQFPLSGSWLRRAPLLALFLAPYRTLKFYLVLLPRLSPLSSLWLLISLPFFALGFLLWAYHFMRGIANQSAIKT
jgi:glycosyltransferase involved in cell wall biosynthesis